MDEYESPPKFRLDGAQRLAVAMELWRKWRFERHGSMLLFGFSGVGKSEGLVRPLQNWAVDQGIPTVWVDIAKDTVDLESWLVDAMSEGLRESAQFELANAEP